MPLPAYTVLARSISEQDVNLNIVDPFMTLTFVYLDDCGDSLSTARHHGGQVFEASEFGAHGGIPFVSFADSRPCGDKRKSAGAGLASAGPGRNA